MDDPEKILSIVEKFPEFEQMYEQAYDICRNIEEVMGMFSKELYELDKNTVQYMIDEMQEELTKEREKNKRVQEELTKERDENKKQKEELQKKLSELEEKLKRNNV